MSRTFNGSGGNDQQLILDVGNITSDGGPITVLTLWRPADEVGGTLVSGIASGATTWGYIEGGDGSYYTRGDFSGVALVDSGQWQIIGYTKANGSATVRWHFRDSAGSWTHTNGSTIADQGAPTTIWIGNGQGDLGGLRLDGDWVCSAVWDSELSDGAVESAGSLTALQAWADASPTALWDGDQSSTSDPVVDRTGGGADEVSAPSTGSPPGVGGPVPSGWSYTISSGITGTLAVAEQADTLAAAGTATAPTVTGTLAVAEADDTLTAAGTHTPPQFTGSLTVTEATDTLAATGTHTPPGVTGTLAATEAADTLAGSGTATAPVFTGTLAVAESSDTLVASGAVVNAGIAGSLSITEQLDVLVAAGTVTAPTYTGIAAITEQADTLTASGLVAGSASGSLAVVEAADTLAAAGVTGGLTPAPDEASWLVPAAAVHWQVAAEQTHWEVSE